MSATFIQEILSKKRFGNKLTDEEIAYFIQKASRKEIHDAQIGAMLMAIAINGMDLDETECLTKEMIHSGYVNAWDGIAVDKHSTGGVGDKVSIALAPALAALGLKVPMLSGRSLEHTGGTLDKLESIPGYRVCLSIAEMNTAINKGGLFMAEPSKDICPADRIIYGMRDATSTVSCLPLIVGSIASKKIAGGAKYCVFDIKVGSSALYKTADSVRPLAQALVNTCGKFGMKARALLTRMETPLGLHVGNALEIKEIIDILQGNGPKDIVALIDRLGGELLEMTGKAKTVEEGIKMMERTFHDGSALEKFKAMLIHHSVPPSDAEKICKDPWSLMKKADFSTPVPAKASGWIKGVDGMTMALVCKEIGGGRSVPGEKIQHSVGVELLKTEGDKVNKGDNLILIHHSGPLPTGILERVSEAFMIVSQPVTVPPFVLEVIDCQ